MQESKGTERSRFIEQGGRQPQERADRKDQRKGDEISLRGTVHGWHARSLPSSLRLTRSKEERFAIWL